VSGRLVSAVVALAALTGGSACGGPSATPTAGSAASSGAISSGGTPSTASCSPAATASPPAGFPASVPIPDATVLTSAETRSGSRLVVGGTVFRDFPTVLKEMQAKYPAAGFTLAAGEVEKNDAESDFSGNGYQGRWGIRAIEGCQATTISVVVGPTS